MKRFQIKDNDHPQKHIDFVKDNLAHIVATKNDVEAGIEGEGEDGE